MAVSTPPHKIGLAIFRDQRIMMARNRKHPDTYITLGGKVEPGETDEQCLAREVMEEAATTIQPGSLQYLADFQGFMNGDPERPFVLRLYSGELDGTPVPSAEIAEFAFFDSTDDPARLTQITNEHIFPWLKSHDLIR